MPEVNARTPNMKMVRPIRDVQIWMRRKNTLAASKHNPIVQRRPSKSIVSRLNGMAAK